MKKLLVLIPFLLLGYNPSTLANSKDSTSFSYGGFIKLDAIASSFSKGSLPSGNVGRDFYVPGLTPVEGKGEGAKFDMHARQSRFHFTTLTPLNNGKSVKTRLELDFMVTPNGNERVSNSYSPRLRIASIEYGNWLFGQSWTTFQDLAAFPETLDFIGVADGAIPVRQAMIRYKNKGFAIAIENPESTVTPAVESTRIVADDNTYPDIIGRYTHAKNWGHISIAGIVRQLSYEAPHSNIDSSILAAGLSLSAKLNVGNNDIRMMINSGSGLGRYLGLNVANGAIIDRDNELNAIKSVSAFIAYRHWWTDKWRSTVSYSFFNADNDINLAAPSTTKSTQSFRFNALYSPAKNMTLGVEYTRAGREIESGLTGEMDRLQFSVKYGF